MKSSPRLCDLTDLERLSRLPDSVPLTSSEAAILLRISLSTLERMRRNGSGPVYSQTGEIGARGSNQKCVYIKSDLDAYLRARQVSSSMEAAVRKGQMSESAGVQRMFTKLDDLRVRRAFHVDHRQKIGADIESLSIDTFIARLGTWEIVWMNALEAAVADWAWPSDRRAFAQAVTPVLKRTLSEVDRYELMDR